VRQGRFGILTLPGAQQVTLAEQLRAEATIDTDAADQQPVEHEQADPVTPRIGMRAVPPPSGQSRDRGHALLNGARSQIGRHRLPQVWIFGQ
jgi:hypothetical protein